MNNFGQENLNELSARLDKHLVRASRVKQETERQIAELKVCTTPTVNTILSTISIVVQTFASFVRC